MADSSCMKLQFATVVCNGHSSIWPSAERCVVYIAVYKVNLKENLKIKDKTHQKSKRWKRTNYESPNNYYHNTSNQSRGRRPYNGQSRNRQFRGFVQRNRGQRPQHSQHQFQNYRYQRSAPQQNCTQYGSARKPYFQGNQVNAYQS